MVISIECKFNAKKYDNSSFLKLQMIRFLDDWAYQANVRAQVKAPCNISSLMKPFEQKLLKSFNLAELHAEYTYPWNRKFEVEVNIL